MITPHLHVDIVIPNFNGVQFLATCLRSLVRQTYPSFSIIVVDNGSVDKSLEFVREHYPFVHLISWPQNKGFSPAVNAGISAGNSPFVFLLNNDTELEADCLEQLVKTALLQDEYDFFAAKMISYHDRHILDGAGDGFLRGGVGYRLGTMENDDARYSRPGRVFGACAGAALYRRELFDAIGLFDEDFFAYLEDVDFNLRANSRGKKCYYVPAARVFHIGSATTGSKINSFTVRLSTRNNLNLLIKNYPLALFFRFGLALLIYQFFWLIFVVKKKQFSAYVSGVVEFVGNLHLMLKKRREVLAGVTLTADELSVIILAAERDVICSIMNRRQAQGKTNRLLSLYTRLFL
ncbi:MAG: glycosyltransferase family 2 protein [Desulfocapsaceae bacterium]|nr:glycosyltransferase family 2 protein [Desulfocapsaceae bacterium]